MKAFLRIPGFLVVLIARIWLACRLRRSLNYSWRLAWLKAERA